MLQTASARPVQTVIQTAPGYQPNTHTRAFSLWGYTARCFAVHVTRAAIRGHMQALHQTTVTPVIPGIIRLRPAMSPQVIRTTAPHVTAQAVRGQTYRLTPIHHSHSKEHTVQ